MKNTKPNPLKVMSIDMVLEDHYNRAQKLKTLQFKPIIIEGSDSHIIGYSLDKKVLIYDGYAIAKQITDERFFDALEGDFMENDWEDCLEEATDYVMFGLTESIARTHRLKSNSELLPVILFPFN